MAPRHAWNDKGFLSLNVSSTFSRKFAGIEERSVAFCSATEGVVSGTRPGEDDGRMLRFDRSEGDGERQGD